MDDRIRRLRDLAAAASRPPWTVVGEGPFYNEGIDGFKVVADTRDDGYGAFVCNIGAPAGPVAPPPVVGAQNLANAKFVALVRNELPWLLSIVLAAKDLLESDRETGFLHCSTDDGDKCPGCRLALYLSRSEAGEP